MIEIFVVAAIFMVLLVIASGGAIVKWNVLLLVGGAVVLVSLVAGVGAGVGYHVALYRILAPRNILKKGWIWNPTSYHGHLSAAGRKTVMPWFYTGVTCLFISFAGCAVVLIGILLM